MALGSDSPATVDNWTPLGPAVDREAPRVPKCAPKRHRRRVAGGTVVRNLLGNSYRRVMEGDKPTRERRREYGDAALFAAKFVDGVLGDALTLTLAGSDTPPPLQGPELPEYPTDPGPEADTAARTIFDIATTAVAAAREETSRKWAEDLAAYPLLVAALALLRQWSVDEQFSSKVRLGEGAALSIGDGVYVVDWSAEHRRPAIKVYAPELFFPEDEEDGFPTRVHFRWELERDEGESGPRMVRQLTYELVDFREDPETGEVTLIDEPAPWDPGATVTRTCLFTDLIAPYGPGDELDLERAVYQVTGDDELANRLDLGIDWMPVYHTVGMATGGFWGQTVLAPIFHLLVDIQAIDTDADQAAALVGVPMVVMDGGASVEEEADDGPRVAKAPERFVEPGAVIETPPGTKAQVVDLSPGLVALDAHAERLLERASINGRVPAEVLGRVTSGDAASGAAILYSTGGFVALCRALRELRLPVLNLVLKHVIRWFRIDGQLPVGADLFPEIEFGQILPSDTAAVVNMVANLLDKGAISPDTAVVMLNDRGVIEVDPEEELARIRAADTAGAVDVANATRSERLAAVRLGEDPDAYGIGTTAPDPTPPRLP